MRGAGRAVPGPQRPRPLTVGCPVCLQSGRRVGASPGGPEDHHLVPLGAGKWRALAGVRDLEIFSAQA